MAASVALGICSVRGDVAGRGKEGGAARRGLHLHEDRGDRDQQADRGRRTQDAELRLDVLMADQRQPALAAPVDERCGAASGGRRLRSALRRSKVGNLKGSLKAMVCPLLSAQRAISR
jgi:hypothetical protein